MERIEIKRATIHEVEQLQKIGKQTFSETFSASNSEENMRKYLEEVFTTEKLSAEINNPNSEFHFAMQDEEVIGYLKLNFGNSQTELLDQRAVEIERIYVLRKFQGKKVGQLLYGTAINVARERSADYVWLGVWEQNQKAINFYKKNGFVEFGKHIFKLGNDEQTDIMMKLLLRDSGREYAES